MGTAFVLELRQQRLRMVYRIMLSNCWGDGKVHLTSFTYVHPGLNFCPILSAWLIKWYVVTFSSSVVCDDWTQWIWFILFQAVFCLLLCGICCICYYSLFTIGVMFLWQCVAAPLAIMWLGTCMVCYLVAFLVFLCFGANGHSFCLAILEGGFSHWPKALAAGG